jgi:small conductance mechanosensitive channel
MLPDIVRAVAESLQESALRALDATARLLPRLTAALVALAVFWALAALTRRAIRPVRRFVDHPTAKVMMRVGAYYVILGVGIVIALDVLGVNPLAVFTGLGLGGVALSFALKEIVENLISGVLILTTQVFAVGDEIVVGDTEGTVERIELRATHIRTYDGRLVIVPNSEIYTSRVTNNTEAAKRRASVLVHLDYDQDVEAVAAVIARTVERVKGVAASPSPSVRLRDLSPEEVELEARFWTDSRHRDFMNTASAVRQATLAALKRRGITLPDPSRLRVSIPDGDDLRGLAEAHEPRAGRDEPR